MNDIDSQTDLSNRGPYTRIHMSHEDDEPRGFSNTAGSDNEAEAQMADLGTNFHEAKWRRFRGFYRDQYLDLYKSTYESAERHFESQQLPSTQLGVVYWNSDEKARLYEGLTRKGRHDLPALSRFVGTKSVLEIAAYLDWIKQQETDRQLFERRTRNISQADIPAAIEIGVECEEHLNKAADALSAFQEHFDYAAGQRSNRLWLIDKEKATGLDAACEKLDKDPFGPQDVSEDASSGSKTELFHLAKFLELSEKIFMVEELNNAAEIQDVILETGETPSMTVDVVNDLYDIVVNLTRRLIQSILFLAQSRLKATTTAQSQSSQLVRHEDVIAAANILKMEENSWDYWKRLPKRRGLAVFETAARMKRKGTKAMSYGEVEEALSGRRLRMWESSSPSSAYSISPNPSKGAPSDDDNDQPHYSADREDEELETSDEGVTNSDYDDSNDSDETDVDSQSNMEEEIQPQSRPTPLQRLERLQEEESEYLERIDQEERQRDETKIFELLGIKSERPVKMETPVAVMGRPKVLRKTAEDIQGWSAIYQAEWETQGNEDQDEDELRDTKRRKTGPVV
ncbi:hypothetical protein PV10_01601 [Exophiala mesophila]|uniref:Uncharacterized protein n=1 Tax=Exophiala mesophila TaxID=212818 RepID=A0A0D1YB93_EXOME|nr:uncharacterized protein PV10_01601 [Exophiala mesophila]KIV97901.1 hypothetical protein PV10_01601 [Exophiala mesophila]